MTLPYFADADIGLYVQQLFRILADDLFVGLQADHAGIGKAGQEYIKGKLEGLLISADICSVAHPVGELS